MMMDNFAPIRKHIWGRKQANNFVMAKLLECLSELYGTKDLYEVLNTKKDASASEIKKAYYKISLQVHPDRAKDGERETATKKFQALSQVYLILSNSEKKAFYDECGEIDDDSEIFQDERDWDSYWRILFKKVTIEDIKEFEGNYRNSEEEAADVITAYVECEGDMDLILERVPCCTAEDDKRFKKIIDGKIKKGEVPEYELFKKENAKKQAARRKKAQSEAEEAAQAAKEIGLNAGEDKLKAMILKRQENRGREMNNFFDQLEAKYSKPSKKAKTSSERKKKEKKK